MYRQQPQSPPAYPPLPPPRGYQPPDDELNPVWLPPKRPSKAPWLLLVLVMLAGGWGGWHLLQNRGEAESRAEMAEATAARAETEKKAAQSQLAALAAERDALVGTRDALTRSVEEKNKELAQLKGAHDQLQEKMKEEIASGDVLLTTSGGRLRVDLVDKILFESGDAMISKRGQSVLARVGAVLGNVEEKQIQVSGHTDNNPISPKLRATYPTNWELSSARATNVVRFLEESAKVPATRLVASGHGQHQPVASNKTATGRARNRRIELLLLPGLAPRPISQAKLKQQGDEAPSK